MRTRPRAARAERFRPSKPWPCLRHPQPVRCLAGRPGRRSGRTPSLRPTTRRNGATDPHARRRCPAHASVAVAPVRALAPGYDPSSPPHAVLRIRGREGSSERAPVVPVPGDGPVKITIPELSLVALIGPTGSGKSTFARKHFKPTEVLSSDYCRGLVSDDENSQAATNDAFDVLYYIVRKRLAAGKLTVIDATNVQPEARKPIVAMAREYHCLPVAIVLNLPDRLCHDRNQGRPERSFGPHVARQQSQALRRSLRHLKDEGFRHVFVLSSAEEVEAVELERQPLWNNLKHDHGPFDVIGDVHGCRDELAALLGQLGYLATETGDGQGPVLRHPEGRKAVFLGDLVDRGPDTPGVLRQVMAMVEAGSALCVPGNHDMKLMRKLRGRNVQITHGLAESLAQLESEPEEFKQKVAAFIDDRV